MAVHPAVQVQAVQGFESEKLEIGDIPGYQEPYLGGQISKVWHRKARFYSSLAARN